MFKTKLKMVVGQILSVTCKSVLGLTTKEYFWIIKKRPLWLRSTMASSFFACVSDQKKGDAPMHRIHCIICRTNIWSITLLSHPFPLWCYEGNIIKGDSFAICSGIWCLDRRNTSLHWCCCIIFHGWCYGIGMSNNVGWTTIACGLNKRNASSRSHQTSIKDFAAIW